MLYNRILLPVDGSEHSMHAVIQATHLARAGGGEVIVMTVMPEIPGVIGGDARKEAEEAVAEEARLLTDPVIEIFTKENIPCKMKVIFASSPANGIVKAADEMKCDIVVMGSRGRNELEGLFLGSVTHSVLTQVTVPVLVVR